MNVNDQRGVTLGAKAQHATKTVTFEEARDGHGRFVFHFPFFSVWVGHHFLVFFFLNFTDPCTTHKHA